jgi:drug/metabolite transporter (DMT)-like permease
MNSALLGSVAALAWGTHDFAARFASRGAGPVNTVFGVTFFGFVALSFWLLASGADVEIVWPSLWLTAVSGIAIAAATLSLFTALTLGPIAIVCPIAASYPALAVLFALFAGVRPGVLEWAAMGAVVIGVVVVAASGREGEDAGGAASGKLKPILFFSILASFGFAVALASGQAAAPVFGDAQTVWLARIFGLATVALLYLSASRRWDVAPRWLPVLGLMGGLDVVALGTTIAAGHLPDPTIATVTSSAFGAVTVLLARVILKERITPVQLAGMVLVFAGVAFLASL